MHKTTGKNRIWTHSFQQKPRTWKDYRFGSQICYINQLCICLHKNRKSAQMNNLFVQLKKNWTLHTQALETQAQIINAAIRSQISREEKKKN